MRVTVVNRRAVPVWAGVPGQIYAPRSSTARDVTDAQIEVLEQSGLEVLRTPEARLTLTCPVCGRTYSTEVGIQAHIRAKHPAHEEES